VIIETIVTTINADGSLNVAPMGPHLESDFTRFELRPYDTSSTYVNLCRTRCGVLHVTEDTLLIARAAIGKLDTHAIETVPAQLIQGSIIVDSASWHEFKVDDVEDSGSRAVIQCRSLRSGTGKSWMGFNRGKHAIVEAAILATRVSIMPVEEIAEQLERLAIIVKKTGGPQEREAFELLRGYVETFSAFPS
jgi:hypothetical protein